MGNCDCVVHIKFSHRVRGLSLELPGSWGLSRETGQASIVQAFTNVSEETAATELHSQLFIHQVHVPEHVTNTLKFKDHLLKEIKGQFSGAQIVPSFVNLLPLKKAPPAVCSCEFSVCILMRRAGRFSHRVLD